jgi:hypothetical protein
MPQSGSEPKFEPELFRTGPKFSPKFKRFAEPDLWSSLRFETEQKNVHPFKQVRTSVNLVKKSCQGSEKLLRFKQATAVGGGKNDPPGV